MTARVSHLQPWLEVVRPPGDRRLRCALFDFDGTLSLLREGWPAVMVGLMFEVLRPLAAELHAEALFERCARDVADSAGQPTIDQMTTLAERVRQFGGTPESPRNYKAEYNRRLLAHIAARREALASGSASPDSMLLAGARPMLETLSTMGLVMCLASGTDEPDVRYEARLLDIDRYFGPHIYGAADDYEASSKEAVLLRLLAGSGVAGRDVVVFGDGHVEIECAKRAGALAVGVASDEVAGGGRVDPTKRQRLLRAGADVIIPDYTRLDELLGLLFP